ncbi:hypothetical protein Tco_0702898 [Tanacetum coccineum]|uniref:Uncharacterized protein n=1 Tax=Tanacetum coccineum TaxID=301880 RepID=A0ABQ4XYM5_9ASTR
MDFPEFYKELDAEFWGSSAKLMELQLIKLKLRLGKNPSRSFRPVKSAGFVTFNVSEDTLNRFKVRGFGSLLEAGTKADTKHDTGQLAIRFFFSVTLIDSSSSKSSSTMGDVLEGRGVLSDVTLSDSSTFLMEPRDPYESSSKHLVAETNSFADCRHELVSN